MTLSISLVTGTSGSVIGQPAQLAQKGGQGWLRVRVATMTGDTSYPSGVGGGYAVSTASLGFSSQILGLWQIATSGSQVFVPDWDLGSGVVRFVGASGQTGTTPSEAASGTNLSTLTCRVVFFGL